MCKFCCNAIFTMELIYNSIANVIFIFFFSCNYNGSCNLYYNIIYIAGFLHRCMSIVNALCVNVAYNDNIIRICIWFIATSVWLHLHDDFIHFLFICLLPRFLSGNWYIKNVPILYANKEKRLGNIACLIKMYSVKGLAYYIPVSHTSITVHECILWNIIIISLAIQWHIQSKYGNNLVFY